MSHIFHPTDLSQASETAFFHALKLTLATEGSLDILHVAGAIDAVEWADFPGVRDTLFHWGLIPEGAPRDIVKTLNIDVNKVIGESGDPVASSTRLLQRKPADIVVLATHQKHDWLNWLSSSVSEPIARNAGQALTLFMPHGIPGFVSGANGTVNLKHVLIPVAHHPHPRDSINAVEKLASALDVHNELKVTLLYVGGEGDGPTTQLPETGQWEWKSIPEEGDVSNTIINYTQQNDVDLVAMTTEGPQGILDAIRGSTTERVMRGIHCPLIAIPELKEED